MKYIVMEWSFRIIPVICLVAIGSFVLYVTGVIDMSYINSITVVLLLLSYFTIVCLYLTGAKELFLPVIMDIQQKIKENKEE